MIKLIHGPTYRYQGETVPPGDLIYVQDHHYDENARCYHWQPLYQTGQHTVVFDHVVRHDEFCQDAVYYPALMAREALEFNQAQIIPDWHDKHRSFNFIINKPRPHRLMLLTMIDQLGLTDYTHSLCWSTNPVSSASVTDFVFGDEKRLERGLLNGTHPNAVTYRDLLQRRVFAPTRVSLVTEPVYYERETMITEKTLMAIYGGTVPIWVGGWRIADYMRDLGFDVFDDVVDHGYQRLEQARDRAARALQDNIHLLRGDCPIIERQRLRHNLDLARSNPWLAQCEILVARYPQLMPWLPGA